jgi:hypothetical protein
MVRHLRHCEDKGLKTPRVVRQYNMVVTSVRLRTNNHCAGEDQPQLFSSQSATSDLTNRRLYYYEYIWFLGCA